MAWTKVVSVRDLEWAVLGSGGECSWGRFCSVRDVFGQSGDMLYDMERWRDVGIRLMTGVKKTDKRFL
jgi:hypothetical protein